MASKREKNEADAEIDLHGMTVEAVRLNLQRKWPDWRGLRSVRIIHGQGEALKPEIERWCREMGLRVIPDAYNPGAVRCFPQSRTLPETPLSNSLREAGLRLTPEQEAYLRDPQAIERARLEAEKKRREEERKRQADAAAQAAKKRADQSLWQAEMNRLDSMEKKRSGTLDRGKKPVPPRIIPKAEMKFQEGFWRAELVRVADTDTDTLKKEKRTGLDKLAPPIPERPIVQTAEGKPQIVKPALPKRNVAADAALFEAALGALDEDEANIHRR